MITYRIAVGSDHAGYDLKEKIKYQLRSMGMEVMDCGTENGDDSVDYPDYGVKVAQSIINGEADMGVIICGSGIGISIAANRFREIRAALCHNADTASLARKHNDANVLALGARVIDEKTAIECVKTFFTTEFDGGRHMKRIEKMS